VCVFAGLLISVLPHLVWWPTVGEPVWIDNHDDVFYASLTVFPRDDHRFSFSLSDPVDPAHRQSLYNPLPAVPGIMIARSLGWGPIQTILAWRIWAGLSLALTWYLLFCTSVEHPWLAALFVVFCLSDIGHTSGLYPLVLQAMALGKVALHAPGSLFGNYIHDQLRILNPALTLPYLLILVWAMLAARKRPTRARVAVAGLAFGLLFYVYLFYWTSVGLALALAFALDRGHRRVYFHAGWIGLLIGLPAILGQYRLKQAIVADWGSRNLYFVSIPRTSELAFGKSATVLVLVAGIWVWSRRRELIFPWLLALSGWALQNHQLITGLGMQNVHFKYISNNMLLFLALVLLAGRPIRNQLRSRRAAWVLTLAGVLYFSSGIVLRWLEATRSVSASTEMMPAYQRYKAMRDDRKSIRLEPGSLVAGDSQFQEYAVVLDGVRPLIYFAVIYSPYVTDADLDSRIALNAYLMGVDRDALAVQQRKDLEGVPHGDIQRDPRLLAEKVSRRLTVYDAVRKDPRPFFNRYNVRYLALNAGSRPGDTISTWSLIQHGPAWDLWERDISHLEREPPATDVAPSGQPR